MDKYVNIYSDFAKVMIQCQESFVSAIYMVKLLFVAICKWTFSRKNTNADNWISSRELLKVTSSNKNRYMYINIKMLRRQ